jgi:hypothetical protein
MGMFLYGILTAFIKVLTAGNMDFLLVFRQYFYNVVSLVEILLTEGILFQFHILVSGVTCTFFPSEKGRRMQKICALVNMYQK